MNKIHEEEAVARRMRRIGRKILVLSGKGGVGKSTVAVNIAVALATAGRRVGLLDIDVHGPSIPNLLGIDGMPIEGVGRSLRPFALGDNLRVMSIGFMLRGSDDAVIWRGPMKYKVIKQFLADVEWGELDYLVVDSPPGTGDEPLSIAQLIPDADGAVIVTTPQDIALIDVRKCINFCRQLSLPVVGVIENMSGFICPKCGERTDIFKTGGGERMAREMSVPFLGKVPIDPGIVSASDEGKPYVINFPHTEAGRIFAAITAPLLHRTAPAGRGGEAAGGRGTAAAAGEEAAGQMHEASMGENETRGKQDGITATGEETVKGDEHLRIALPVAGGRLCLHFGHSEGFALVDVDRGRSEVLSVEMVAAPEHQPGLLPTWLQEHGADLVIAGGMGSRAQALFRERGIDVITGAPAEEPEKVARSYLAGSLVTGENVCDH